MPDYLMQVRLVDKIPDKRAAIYTRKVIVNSAHAGELLEFRNMGAPDFFDFSPEEYANPEHAILKITCLFSQIDTLYLGEPDPLARRKLHWRRQRVIDLDKLRGNARIRALLDGVRTKQKGPIALTEAEKDAILADVIVRGNGDDYTKPRRGSKES